MLCFSIFYLKKPFRKRKNSDVGKRLGANLNILAFADDIVLIAKNKEVLKHIADFLVEETTYVGLRINYPNKASLD